MQKMEYVVLLYKYVVVEDLFVILHISTINF